MTDVKEILGGNSSPAEEEARVPDSGAPQPTDEETASRPVVSSEVPSGYTIHYCSDPREYRIGEEWETATPVPSVTTVLDCLSKPALTWWGQRIGVQGIVALADIYGRRDGSLDNDTFADWFLEQTPESLVKLLTEHKLTVNHQRDSAARRGTSVHNALESWAVTGQLADPDDFPEEEAGFVRGLNAFLADCKGRLEPFDAELMVGSKRHGFAGRMDLRGQVAEELTLQTGPRTQRVLPAGRGLLDLKTSKNVYQSHFLQLSGYRGATEECGYGRSEWEAVLLVRANGTYDIRTNPLQYDQFLTILSAWRALN